MRFLTSILLSIAVLVSLASCGHSHDYGEWQLVKAATCTKYGIKAQYCDCGAENTSAISPDGHDWGDAICTQPITCRRCQETDGDAVKHHMTTDGTCFRCGKIMCKISLPNLPITVSNIYSYSGRQSTLKITEMSYRIFSDKIEFTYAGEKTYDIDGSTDNDRCKFTYKLYDAEGHLVDGSSDTTCKLAVGDKFKNETFTVYLDEHSTAYTLVIENHVLY